MGKSTISMAIFNSYVKLPEGKHCYNMAMEIPQELNGLVEKTWKDHLQMERFSILQLPEGNPQEKLMPGTLEQDSGNLRKLET